MQRISVIGTSGSGKTTLAHRIAAVCGAPVIPMDAVFHQPGWTPLPADEFRRRMAELTAGERWVTDGNYSDARDIVWGAADLIVWLDLPKWLVMVRMIGRTAVRAVTGRELWNGNRESWRDVLSRDPERSIIVWAWTTHGERRRRYAAEQAMDSSGARWVRLRTRGEVDRFVSTLAG